MRSDPPFNHKCTHWLCIGGGPSAREMEELPTGCWKIGSNRCLEWVVPDVYWISDPMAIDRYAHLWKGYKGEIICNADLGQPTTRFPYLNAGPLFHGSSSGICICRVALERGAMRLTLIGFDGHKPEDTLNDAKDQPWIQYGANAERRNKAMAASFRDMGEKHPDVEFVHWGATLIELPTDLPNWGHVE